MSLPRFCLLLALAFVLDGPLVTWAADALPASPLPDLVLVVGAPGESDYATNFTRQVESWCATAARAQARTGTIGLSPSTGKDDRVLLQETLTAQATNGTAPLWLVFIGHGTFDGKEARFNLRGPDVSAGDLAVWLQPLRRPLIFIDTTSASAPFLNRLSATNRIIVTATRSGSEQNFARFGQFFAAALSDPAGDLDQDGQTSVLEAFLAASAQVAEFYKSEGRLATEHALLDDNGDGLGIPADWFRGTRAVKKPEGTGAVDGLRARQAHLVFSAEELKLPVEVRAKRDAIELEIARLRETKSSRPEPEYYRELELLLARLLEAYGDRL